MPGDWQAIPFEQLLAEPVRNGIYKSKQYHGRGAKIVNMGELFAYPRLRSVPMKRIELSASESKRFMLAKGDLIFARRSLTAEGAGKCSVVLDISEPTTFESSIIRARPDPRKVDPLYLYYFFNSAPGFHSLDTIRRQVAVAGITGSDLSRLEIPVPRLAEQRAIAHILGTLDDKIELNRRMNETLEAMARALFKSWFVDFDPVRAKAEGRARQDGARSGQQRKPLNVASDLPWPGAEAGAEAEGDPGLPKHIVDLFPDRFEDSELGEIPKGWRVGVVGDIAEINAKTLGRADAVKVIDYIEISEVMGGEIGNIVRYERGAEPSRARRRLTHGDTVLSTVRPDRGAHFLCLDPSETLVASTGFAVLSARGGHWAFLYTALTRPEVGEELGRLADGGAYPAVRPEAVGRLCIEVPTERRILLAFEELARPLFERATRSRIEMRTLAALRDTLLPKLISGELRVNDAERFLSGVA